MKNKIFTILQTLFLIAFLVTIVACNDGLSVPEKETSDKPVLKIVIPQAERLVAPDSDFSNFSFELKAGEKTLGSYNGSNELTADIIDLAANEINIGDEVTFTLSAVKDNISWTGTSAATTIAGGENIVTIRLYIKTLGTGNGSISYTFDYSEAPTKADVVSAHFTICSSTDSNANPILDKWYGLDANGNAVSDAIPSDCKIVLEKANVPSGSYHLTAQLYAEGRQTSLVREWGETILVAEGTVSTGTTELKNLNKAHTVTFDLNYTGSTPIVRKMTYLTKLGDFDTPLRKGYVFKGWFLDQACTTTTAEGDYHFYGMVNENAPDDDAFTVYAKWQEFAPGVQTVSIFDSETLYVTPENYAITNLDWFNEKNKWYKVNTVPGTQYKIRWINSDNCGVTNYIYNGNVLSWAAPLGSINYCYNYFGAYRISIYNDAAALLELKNKNGSEITNPNGGADGVCQIIFTATSEETYINVELTTSTLNKIGAFRVMNYDQNAEEEDSLFAVAKVLKDEIGVSFRRAGTTQTLSGNLSNPYIYLGPYEYRFYIDNADDYESFAWYINGKLVSESSSFSLACIDYAVGVYTVTLEAVKESNDDYYSYNAQVKITEVDQTKGAR